MNLPLTPNSADALLFDLGRVVLDIDFSKVVASWAGHARCEPSRLVGRFSPDEAWRRHERGEISDAAFFEGLRASLGIDITDIQFLEGWNAIFAGEMPGIATMLARAGARLPLYAFSNTNGAHVEHFSRAYADLLGHFREASSSMSARQSQYVFWALMIRDPSAPDQVEAAAASRFSRCIPVPWLTRPWLGQRAVGLPCFSRDQPEPLDEC